MIAMVVESVVLAVSLTRIVWVAVVTVRKDPPYWWQEPPPSAGDAND